MKLQHFHIEIADWSREDQRAALLDLRATVFIHEQGVSEQREREKSRQSGHDTPSLRLPSCHIAPARKRV